MSTLGRAQVTLTADDKQMQQTLQRSQKTVSAWGASVKTAVVAAAAAFAAIQVVKFGVGFAKDLIEMASAQEDAESKLDAALKATNQSLGNHAQKLRDTASGLQTVTKHGDEALMPVMALGLNMGIAASGMDAATKAAIGLSEVTGKGLEESMRMVAEATTGNTQKFEEMIPSLKGVTDQAERAAMVQEFLRAGFEQAQASADTFSGRSAQLWNRIGDLGEVLGGLLMPALEGFNSLLDQGVAFLENNAGAIKNLIGLAVEGGSVVRGWLAQAFEILLTGMVGAFTVGEMVASNWRDSLELYAKSVLLSFVTMFNSIVHFLTVVVPGYLVWFANNWREIFTDIANYTQTVIRNMLKNLVDFFVATKRMLDGKSFSFKWTGLTKGFEASLSQLPDIAKRIPGELEDALASDVRQLGFRVFGGFDKAFNDRMARVRAMFKGAEPSAEAAKFEGITIAPPAPPEEEKKDEKKAAEAAEVAAAKTRQAVQVSVEGLAQVFQRIQGAAATQNAPEERTAMAAEKSVETGERTARAAEDTRRGTDQVAAALGEIKEMLASIVRGNLVGSFGA